MSIRSIADRLLQTGLRRSRNVPAPGANGKLIHATICVCNASIMLIDENADYGMLGPQALGGSPVTIHLMVEDVDAFVARAEAAGAKIIMPVADRFWGDRYGIIEDPFGHRWSIATHQRDMTAEEIEEAMRQAVPEYGQK
jgi:PhnB protein